MPHVQQRRSPRLALELPIRVYGTDFRGRDFVEDAVTLIVNRQGGKIRLLRQLIPEQEIRIMCRQSAQEAIFRVVSRSGESRGAHSFWGIECLLPEANVWGLQFPPLGSKDGTAARLMLYCPECRTQELLFVDETLIQSIQEQGGLKRGCLTCAKSTLWKKVPYWDS